MKIDVTSKRKGSNPGGNCIVTPTDFREFKGYFKYCHGSKLLRKFSFVPENQPVYEAITFALANKFGLHSPPVYILRNEGRKLEFRNCIEHSKKDHAGRDFYFLSEIMDETPNTNEAVASGIIADEEIYLNGLMISDVVNKRQNYLFQKDATGSRVVYLDLGCSFVRAVGGFLESSNAVAKKINLCEKDKRRNRRSLRSKLLIPADNSEPVSLEELSQGVGDLEIRTLNPYGTKKVSELIGREEIDEIELYLQFNFVQNFARFKERGVLTQ